MTIIVYLVHFILSHYGISSYTYHYLYLYLYIIYFYFNYPLGFARVADLLRAGVNVGLGTDSTASNNSLDMFSELKLAAVLAKGVSKGRLLIHLIDSSTIINFLFS